MPPKIINTAKSLLEIVAHISVRSLQGSPWTIKCAAADQPAEAV